MLTREEFHLNGLWICGSDQSSDVRRILAHVADWMISLMTDEEIIEFWCKRNAELSDRRVGEQIKERRITGDESKTRLDCPGH